MSKKSPRANICQRIGQVRRELHGDRGKARFAKQLGISPSTYNYYETARTPPAQMLVKIADLAGVDLRWLLTGELSAQPVPAQHPAVQRVMKLLADHPAAAGPLAAFVDILAQTFGWPAKDEGGAGGKPVSGRPVVGESGQEPARQPAPAAPAGRPKRDWIPVLGRSAAGVPQFWAEEGEGGGVALLEDLVERHARRSARQVRPATAAADAGGGVQPAQIITLTAPDADNLAEFIVAGTLKQRYPDAFAVRIDGDSMAPEIRHGDVVICSASAPPGEGAAAVVQLAGQIGVTCKIFRRAGETVHLVPVNEQYRPQAFPADEVVWARRVLARVRPGGAAGEAE